MKQITGYIRPFEVELAESVNPNALPAKTIIKFIKKQVTKNKILDKLRLTEWDIKFDTGPCEEPTWAAQCAQDPAYKIAHIRIDPNHHESLDEVAESFIHELMHIVISPVESFNMIQMAGLDSESPQHGRHQEHWRQSNEQLVCTLSRIYKPLMGDIN